MNETFENKALIALADGPLPLVVLARRLECDQRTAAAALTRARHDGLIERFWLKERLKTRRGSFKPGTEMYRLP